MIHVMVARHRTGHGPVFSLRLCHMCLSSCVLLGIPLFREEAPTQMLHHSEIGLRLSTRGILTICPPCVEKSSSCSHLALSVDLVIRDDCDAKVS